MTATQYVFLILSGGVGTPLVVFLIARHLVYRHGDPAAAEAYYAARNAERAAEVAPLLANQRRAARPKELTR